MKVIASGQVNAAGWNPVVIVWARSLRVSIRVMTLMTQAGGMVSSAMMAVI